MILPPFDSSAKTAKENIVIRVLERDHLYGGKCFLHRALLLLSQRGHCRGTRVGDFANRDSRYEMEKPGLFATLLSFDSSNTNRVSKKNMTSHLK
jgi:hypothetical protein